MLFVEQINRSAQLGLPGTNVKPQSPPFSSSPAYRRQDEDLGIFQFRIENNQERALSLQNIQTSNINDNGVVTLISTDNITLYTTTEPTSVIEAEQLRIDRGVAGFPEGNTWKSLNVVKGTQMSLPDNVSGIYVKGGAGGQVTIRRS